MCEARIGIFGVGDILMSNLVGVGGNI